MWIVHRKEIWKLTFRALALRSDASKSLYGGQFTLSTQLIKPNYLVILPPTQHHSFFRNLPPLFIYCTLVYYGVFFEVPRSENRSIQRHGPPVIIMQFGCRVPRCRQHFTVQRVTYGVELGYRGSTSFESYPPTIHPASAPASATHYPANLTSSAIIVSDYWFLLPTCHDQFIENPTLIVWPDHICKSSDRRWAWLPKGAWTWLLKY